MPAGKRSTRIARSRIIVECLPETLHQDSKKQNHSGTPARSSRTGHLETGWPVREFRKQDGEKEDTNLELHSLRQKLRSQESGAHRKLRMDLEVL